MKSIFTSILLFLACAHHLYGEPGKASQLNVLTDLDKAKTMSKESGKPVFLEFMSSTCPHCQAFEKTVLSDPGFVKYANQKLIVVIHDYQALDNLPAGETKARKDLMTKLKVESFPTILLIDKSGDILLRTSGYSGTPADKIIASLKAAQEDD